MISYAQNFEDVMLWRALKNVKNGFYVDVGAGRPELDSVTKHFYEQGWHGINIEPHSEDFPLLAAARPRDVNLKIAIGPQKGAMTFYENKIRGWSTLDRGTATEMLGLGGDSVEVQVECLRLQEVLDQYSDGPIHFLKIDVEGYEEEVLKSIDLKKSRPWIVVLEAADIHARLPDPSKSFLQLVKNGYELVYTDALNFFYISQEKSEELKPHFQKPPNIFDGFVHFNSRDQQQHAQYQDLRNIVAEGRASEGALKAEILALGQHYKELGAGMETARQESAKTREATQALDQKLQESLNQGLKSGQNLKNELKAQQEAVATSIGSLKEELAQQQKSQQENHSLDQTLFKGLIVELKETREKEVERGQELRQELEAQKVATTKGVKELGDSLVGLKEELIHELRGLVGGLNERQDQLQQRNLAEMDALRTSLVDRQRESENNFLEVAKYAEQIQDSVVSPSSYLIPAPFSWYSCLYKMLKVKKPVILNKNKTSGEAPKRPGFWRRLERSIRKRKKRLFGRIGFDRKWYLQEYPEIGPSGIDPLDHWLRFGVEEQRWKSRRHKEKALASGLLRKKRPGFFRRLEISIRKRRKRWTNYWTFDPAWYLEANPDVRAGGIDPLQHYISFGKKEGRQKREPETDLIKVISKAFKRACGLQAKATARCFLTRTEGPWWILNVEVQRPAGYFGGYRLRLRCGKRETYLQKPGTDYGGTVRFRHIFKHFSGPSDIRADWSEEGWPLQQILKGSNHFKKISQNSQSDISASSISGHTDMTVMPKYGFFRSVEKKLRKWRKNFFLKQKNKTSIKLEQEIDLSGQSESDLRNLSPNTQRIYHRLVNQIKKYE